MKLHNTLILVRGMCRDVQRFTVNYVVLDMMEIRIYLMIFL